MQGMQVEDLPGVDTNIDLTQILPIQQKRTIAFVNHFIMQTVSYLNNFAHSCESRFMEFEYKIQKIEASLLILESQLSSIAGLNLEQNETSHQTNNISENVPLDLPDVGTTQKIPAEGDSEIEVKPESVPSSADGVKACDDPRYKKFFKMLQFGVPEPAVKLKMQNEGVDPGILDKPNDVIPGLPQDTSAHSVEHNSSESD